MLLLMVLAACGREAPVQTEFAGGTMGTQYSVKLVTATEIEDSASIRDKIQASLDEVEQLLSTYLPDSEISLFNAMRSTEWVPVSTFFCDGVEKSLQISALTDGAFRAA